METNMRYFYLFMAYKIVNLHGGFRERDIINKPHTVERSETWNEDHKVLNVFESEPQPDGHRNGFSVDLVTKTICG